VTLAKERTEDLQNNVCSYEVEYDSENVVRTKTKGEQGYGIHMEMTYFLPVDEFVYPNVHKSISHTTYRRFDMSLTSHNFLP